MTAEDNPLSPEQLVDYARSSGRGLRLMHDGDYQGAIEVYRRLVKQWPLPANVLYLARACQEAGSISEALRVLEDGVRRYPNEAPLGEELGKLKGRRYELLVRYAVQQMSNGASPAFCRDLLESNAELADDTLLRAVRENAFHYAQQMKSSIFVALATLHEALCQRWTDDLHLANRLEIQALAAEVRGELSTSVTLLREAAGAARRAADKELLCSCLNQMGLAAAAAGAFHEADASFREAIALCESRGDARNAARFCENLGAMYLNSNPSEGLKVAHDAQLRYEAVGEAGMRLKARSLEGKCLAAMGRWDQALRVLNECVERGPALWRDTPIVMLETAVAKANVLENMGRLNEAEAVRGQVEAMACRLGVHYPIPLVERSGSLWQTNRFDDAKAELEERIRRFDAAGRRAEAARERTNLAGVHMASLATRTMAGAEATPEEIETTMKNFSRAKDLLEQAIAAIEPSEAPMLLLGAKMRYANLIAVEGKTQENPGQSALALAEYDSCLELARTCGAECFVADLLENKSTVLENLGRHEESQDVLEQRLALNSGALPRSATACHLLAGRLAGAGRDREATRLYERAMTLYDREESNIGSDGLVIDWSRDKVGIFDTAIEYFVGRNCWEDALRVCQRAKARTFRRALGGTGEGTSEWYASSDEITRRLGNGATDR
jgi:tetratricopeptide (TPR) repeat protein